MKRIDVHNHVIPETLVKAMQANPVYNTQIEGEGHNRVFIRGKVRFPFEAEFYNADAKLESMDRKKIDIAFISPGPQCFFYNLKDDLAIQTARLVNDGIAQMVAAKPDRLRGMATLPMQHPEAAIAELKRIEELKVMIFAHPNTQGSGGRLDCFYLTNLIGNPLDTTIMVGKLMFSGALDELKDLKILLAHGGGFLPYQIGRFVHGHKVRPDTAAVTKSDPHEMLKRFWFDALTHSPQSIRHLIDIVGSEKVVLGTDAPFDMGEMAPVDRVELTPGLTQKERENIYCNAATALFNGKI